MDPSTRKVLWLSVIGGVISGVVVVFLVEPIFKFAGALVISVAGRISQQWADRIYREAAQPVIVSEQLFFVLAALVFIMIAFWIIDPHMERTSPPLRVGFASSLGVIALLLMVFGAITSNRLDLERCFHSRLSVLSPHLSDRELKELSARWSLMRSRTEFDAINRQIGEYARKYDVPEVVKSLESQRTGRCL